MYVVAATVVAAQLAAAIVAAHYAATLVAAQHTVYHIATGLLLPILHQPLLTQAHLVVRMHSCSKKQLL